MSHTGCPVPGMSVGEGEVNLGVVAGMMEVYRGRESHNATMTTISRLHQPLYQLSILKHGSIVQTESLNPTAQGTACVTIQHVGSIFLVHRHHLTLHTLRPWHRLPKPPGTPVGVAMETEGTRCRLADLAKAFFTVDVVGIGWNQKTT